LNASDMVVRNALPANLASGKLAIHAKKSNADAKMEPQQQALNAPVPTLQNASAVNLASRTLAPNV